MTDLSKLRLLARYNILTPVMLLGLGLATPAVAGVDLALPDNSSTTIDQDWTADGSTPGAVYTNGLTGNITSLINPQPFTIDGGDFAPGVFIGGNAGTFDNAGTIQSSVTAAVDVEGAVDTFVNSGQITGESSGPGAGGVYIGNGAGAFTNSGHIDAYYDGVKIQGQYGSGGVSVQSFTNGGYINSTDGTGVYIEQGAGSFVNNGHIEAFDDGVQIWGNTGVQTFTNNGSISSSKRDGVYIYATAGTFANSGSISGARGVYAEGIGAFHNLSTGQITGENGTGVDVGYGGVNSFVNDGIIEGNGLNRPDVYGVYSSGYVGSLTNSKTIQATSQSTGYSSGRYAYGVYLNEGVGDFLNTGSVSSSIMRGGYAAGVFSESSANTFTNTGSVSATSTDAEYTGATGVYFGSVGTFINKGQISATASSNAYGYAEGVYIGNSVGSFVNDGSISATANGYEGTTEWATGVYFDGTVGSFVNNGSITASAINGYDNDHSYGVYAREGADSFVNRGTISGGTGIYIGGDGGNRLDDYGTIQGTDSRYNYAYGAAAVEFDTALANTFAVHTGAKVLGGVDFGDHSSDLFDFSDYHGSLVLEEFGSLPQGNVAPGNNLWIQTSHQVIIVGPTAQQYGFEPIFDLTDGIRNFFDSQENGSGGSGPRTDEVVANYAPTPKKTDAQAAVDNAISGPIIPSGTVVYATGIGGGSSGPNATDLYGALVVGARTSISAGLSGGALAGYGSTNALYDAGTHSVHGDYAIASVNGAYHTDLVDLEFSLIGGIGANHSVRTIQTGAGTQSATGDFGSWFLAPELTAEVPVLTTDKSELKVVGKIGYIGGAFGGYTETGSSFNMTVAAQAISILNVSLGLAANEDLGTTDAGVIRGKASADVFMLDNSGGATVPVSFNGTALNGYQAPTGVSLGVEGGFSLEYPVAQNVNVTASFKTSVRSDWFGSSTANLALRGSF